MKIYKCRNYVSIRFGGVSGVENFMLKIEFWKKSPHIKMMVCFNTDKLIKVFKCNQKIIELF